MKSEPISRITDRACYRRLKKYKYQLVRDYLRTIPITGEDIDTEFIALNPGGALTIKSHYAWDGASGPTIDTRSFMRGSLVHDALYQLMRLGRLDDEKYRKTADELLRDICREDGMSRFRSGYAYAAVRWLGGKHARPTPDAGDEIICIPPE